MYLNICDVSEKLSSIIRVLDFLKFRRLSLVGNIITSFIGLLLLLIISDCKRKRQPLLVN